MLVMEKIRTTNQNMMPVLVVSLLMLFNCSTANAGTLGSSCTRYQPIAGYVVGTIIYQSSPPRPFWTGWRYEGNCRKNCKVDRWTGRVYRCKRVCRY